MKKNVVQMNQFFVQMYLRSYYFKSSLSVVVFVTAFFFREIWSGKIWEATYPKKTSLYISLYSFENGCIGYLKFKMQMF